MKLRTRLTLLFIVIVAVIITLASISIYYFSADYREDDFYTRLYNRGISTAKLLIEVEEVDVDLLRRMDRNNPIRLNKEMITIYNYRNDILYTTDDENVFSVDNDLLDRIRLDGRVRYEHEGFEVLGFLYSDEFDRFVVVIGATDIYGLGKLRNLRYVLYGVLAVSIIIVSIAAWIYAGRALKPISGVISDVQEITITSLDRRLSVGNEKDELAQLAQTFNEMLDRLEVAFIVQRNFIANASHELRTPLTAIIGQMEVLLMKARSPEEYQEASKSILEDIKNLTALANRLLLLAQTSSISTISNPQAVRIDELIWQVRDELIKRHTDYTINLQMDESIDDEHKLVIPGDEQLLKTVVLNLAENGCKFSTNHQVDITISAENTTLVLTVADKGIGIHANDIPYIFEPFHRGKNTASIRGHGIGLSLVESIVKSHHGSIEVDSKPGEGTVFKLRFPFLN